MRCQLQLVDSVFAKSANFQDKLVEDWRWARCGQMSWSRRLRRGFFTRVFLEITQAQPQRRIEAHLIEGYYSVDERRSVKIQKEVKYDDNVLKFQLS
jgi:hypothetical protein